MALPRIRIIGILKPESSPAEDPAVRVSVFIRFLLATCVIVSACGPVEPEDVEAEYYTPEEFASEVDTWALDVLKNSRCESARGWLAKPENILFEGDAVVVQRLVDDLYTAGAVKLWFTGIEKIGNANVSPAIAAEMPDDPNSRRQLLSREAAYWGHEEANIDVGQRYLGFSFD